jgi:hypothetical protein
MIKELEARDILKIKDIETGIKCDKGQYIQFLISKLQDPNYFMWGDIENNEINSFIVINDNRQLPINNSVLVLDMWSRDHRQSLAITEYAKKWAVENNVERILIMVDDDHSEKYMNAFGVKKVANVFEWKFK